MNCGLRLEIRSRVFFFRRRDRIIKLLLYSNASSTYNPIGLDCLLDRPIDLKFEFPNRRIVGNMRGTERNGPNKRFVDNGAMLKKCLKTHTSTLI
jgi:hypothetical protein